MADTIYKLDIAALRKALGLKAESPDGALLDGVQLTHEIERYLIAEAGAAPAPVFGAGLQPMIVVGTGSFSIPASTNRVGNLEVFGGASVSGTDPGAGKFARYATPPNRDWLCWGGYIFLGKEQAGTGMEMNVILQRTIGTSATEEQLFLYALDVHAANQSFPTSWPAIMLPRPYRIGAGQQLYMKWQANNTEALARNADLQVHIFWEYA